MVPALGLGRGKTPCDSIPQVWDGEGNTACDPSTWAGTEGPKVKEHTESLSLRWEGGK